MPGIVGDAQVDVAHYYNHYDTIDRFISYFYQSKIVRNIGYGSILEVGVGNKTLTNYLKQNGFDVTCCDFDKNLCPDYVADVRQLPFADNSFDIVLAFEVLEHLPWDDFEKALSELRRVSRKNVILSIPYSSATFGLVVHFPLIERLLKKPFVELLFLRIPYFFRPHKFLGEHYWEMGKKGFPKRKVTQIIQKRFTNIKEIRPVLNPIHYFFVLEK